MKKQNSTKPTSRCNVLNISLVVLVLWLCVLYYFHVNKEAVDTLKHEADAKIHDAIAALVAETESISDLLLPHAAPPEEVESLDKTVLDKFSPKVKEFFHVADVESNKDPDDDIHIVFSTDCSFYQDWQTLLVFHSAMTIGQKGTVTRIASGCDEAKQAELTSLYTKLYPQYHVHFTPDFKMDGKTKKKYDFYNKPYGVQHWLEHAQPAVPSGVVVALIDPDMILLRPLTVHIAGEKNLINLYSFNQERDTVPDRVKSGVAAAQLYGLGAPWTTRSSNFNRTDVCGVGSPCLKVETKFGEDHYSVGPPYILERDDLWKLTRSWTEFVPKVYERYPELLAEMYAYSMAAAHVDLPHFTAHHWMVSNTFADDEGWPWVDALGDRVCEDPVNGVYYPDRPMPTLLHYCQFFRAGEIGFQKRRIRGEIFQCDKPMMLDLPKDLGKVDYKNRDGEIIKLPKKQAQRNAFMLCAIHKSINAMVRHYKERVCTGEVPANYDTKINVVSPQWWK